MYICLGDTYLARLINYIMIVLSDDVFCLLTDNERPSFPLIRIMYYVSVDEMQPAQNGSAAGKILQSKHQLALTQQYGLK